MHVMTRAHRLDIEGGRYLTLRVTWWHIVGWMIVLTYFTCSATPYLFHWSGFRFDTHPNFQNLLMMDFAFSNPIYTVSKISHCLGFVILDMLLSARLRRARMALIASILFACATEFAQLFLSRDGRIYDVVIDGLGALIGWYILSIWRRKRKTMRHM